MALKRAFLKALGIEDEKVDEIINAHTETVNGLKDEIEKYKADAEKLPSVQAALEKANETVSKGEKDPYKVKYEALKEEFEGYKTEATKKETMTSKTAAYKALLKELRINGKITDKVLKLADLETVELDDKGTIKDADKLKESLKNEWADFIVKEGSEGGRVDNPPANNNVDADKMSDDDYYKSIFKKKE
jgi:hypothetical protein